MLHTITAAICLHPILSAAEIPNSIYGIDFAIPYCGKCTKSREIAAEHDTAERERDRLEETQDQEGDPQALREARTRYKKAQLAYLADQELQTRPYRNEHGALPGGGAAMPIALDPILKDLTTPRPKKDHTVRFYGKDEFRREEEYRDSWSFDRTATDYEPGLYADDSGNGYLNTSDPWASGSSSEFSEVREEREEKDVLSSDDGSKLASDKESGMMRYREMEELSDLEMLNVSDDAEEENRNDAVAHVSFGDHSDADDEDGDSDREELTQEGMKERIIVLQERIDQLWKERKERKLQAVGTPGNATQE